MTGALSNQLAIRAIMRALAPETVERALVEMEKARISILHTCDSYDLLVLIRAIRMDLDAGKEEKLETRETT